MKIKFLITVGLMCFITQIGFSQKIKKFLFLDETELTEEINSDSLYITYMKYKKHNKTYHHDVPYIEYEIANERSYKAHGLLNSFFYFMDGEVRATRMILIGDRFVDQIYTYFNNNYSPVTVSPHQFEWTDGKTDYRIINDIQLSTMYGEKVILVDIVDIESFINVKMIR